MRRRPPFSFICRVLIIVTVSVFICFVSLSSKGLPPPVPPVPVNTKIINPTQKSLKEIDRLSENQATTIEKKEDEPVEYFFDHHEGGHHDTLSSESSSGSTVEGLGTDSTISSTDVDKTESDQYELIASSKLDHKSDISSPDISTAQKQQEQELSQAAVVESVQDLMEDRHEEVEHKLSPDIDSHRILDVQNRKVEKENHVNIQEINKIEHVGKEESLEPIIQLEENEQKGLETTIDDEDDEANSDTLITADNPEPILSNGKSGKSSQDVQYGDDDDDDDITEIDDGEEEQVEEGNISIEITTTQSDELSGNEGDDGEEDSLDDDIQEKNPLKKPHVADSFPDKKGNSAALHSASNKESFGFDGSIERNEDLEGSSSKVSGHVETKSDGTTNVDVLKVEKQDNLTQNQGNEENVVLIGDLAETEIDDKTIVKVLQEDSSTISETTLKTTSKDGIHIDITTPKSGDTKSKSSVLEENSISTSPSKESDEQKPADYQAVQVHIEKTLNQTDELNNKPFLLLNETEPKTTIVDESGYTQGSTRSLPPKDPKPASTIKKADLIIESVKQHHSAEIVTEKSSSDNNVDVDNQQQQQQQQQHDQQDNTKGESESLVKSSTGESDSIKVVIVDDDNKNVTSTLTDDSKTQSEHHHYDKDENNSSSDDDDDYSGVITSEDSTKNNDDGNNNNNGDNGEHDTNKDNIKQDSVIKNSENGGDVTVVNDDEEDEEDEDAGGPAEDDGEIKDEEVETIELVGSTEGVEDGEEGQEEKEGGGQNDGLGVVQVAEHKDNNDKVKQDISVTDTTIDQNDVVSIKKEEAGTGENVEHQQIDSVVENTTTTTTTTKPDEKNDENVEVKGGSSKSEEKIVDASTDIITPKGDSTTTKESKKKQQDL